MKRLLLYLLAVATIVACSKSDDVGGGNNNNNETPKQPEVTLSTTTADFSTDGGSNVITFTSSEAWTAQVVNTRADDWCSIEPTSGSAGNAKITVTTTANDTPDDRTASIIIKTGTASKTINVSQKQKNALTVTSSKFEVSAEGGEILIEVKANIDFEYAIEESAADWVEYKATRALKTSNLVFEVKENNDIDKREAKIVISSDDMEEVVTIYQEGAEPSIILTENEFAVSSSAETIAVEVKSNVDVTVELPTDADWITENTTRAFSTNTYYFDIEQNDGYNNRTAQIKFTNKATGIYEYVTITQMQRDAIVVAKDSYTVDSEGDEIVIEVGHNIDFDVEIANDWITRKDTRAFVTDKLTFVIAANKGYDNRESTIKFTSKDRGITQTVKVYQAQENALIVSKKDIVVSDKGGDVEFVIQTNVEFTVSKPDVSWLREATTRGLTSHTLRYEVNPNTSYDSREAKIVVTNRKDNTTETITITQAQKDAIVLAKDSYTVDSEGDEIVIEVGHNIDFDIEIADDWITRKETRAFKTDKLTFVIAANKGYDNRESTIKFTSKDRGITQTVKVYQAQDDALIVSKKDIVVSDEGGDVEFVIQTNVDFTVSKPNVSWLREVTTRGLTSHTLRYEVDPNTSYDSREAKIVVTNRKDNTTETITITQAQKDAIVLAKDSYTVDSEGDEIVIEVGHNIDFDIEIADDWITRKETRAFKTDKLTFVIAANKGYDNRESTIKFTSKDRGITQTVKVYQAQENALIVSKKDIVVSDKGGEVEFVIQTNVEFTVSKPDVSWLREVTTRGLTSHTLRYEVDPNTSYDSREAKIVVTNRKDNTTESITITQAQKDAIVLAKSEYELGTEGGELDFDIQTNVDITVIISDTAKSWITQIETRGLETKTLHFDIAACAADEDREGTITISGGNAMQTITVKQSGLKEVLEKEREALIAFYKATGGDNWTHNDNWCSDKPVSEWYGINVYDISTGEPFNSRRVKSIHLPINNLVGELPKELFNLSELKDIYIADNYGLQGVIPKEIGQLSKLERLSLFRNSLSGDIPKELWTLTNLKEINLENNNLTGNIDPAIGNLTELKILALSNNDLSGSIPAEIVNLTSLINLNIAENELTGSIPTDIGKMQNLVYIQLCGNLLSGNIPESIYQIPTLTLLHLARNKLSGDIPESLGDCLALEELFLEINELTGAVPASLSKIPTLNYLHLGSNKLSGEIPSALGNCPALEVLCLYDNELTGNLPEEIINILTLKELRIHNNKLDGECSELVSTFIEDLDYYSIDQQDGYELKLNFYHSTDFSQDGKIITLQQHTKGPGIKFVITMDGFSDRLIADGTVDKYIQMAHETLFSEEPYTSFKEYFDVYAVLTVSKREKLFTDTALKTDSYDDKLSLQHDIVEAYAKKVPVINNDMSNTHILVILNDKSGLRSNCSWTSYGSMSCATISMNDASTGRFDRIIRHEVLGHGFGRLGDEYVETPNPFADEDKDLFKNFPEEEKQNVRNEHQKGWYLNVDVTNDPEKVIWKDFLSNPDYASENLGIYEGALHYERGAYRASLNSIMRDNFGDFNAPSRWAIYKHIMEIAGEEYSFDTFLEYDKKNLVHTRSVDSKTALSTPIDPRKLGAKPVFLNR